MKAVKKKRNKKHNPLKGYEAGARVISKNKLVVYCAGEQYRLYDTRTDVIDGATQAQRDSLSRVKHKWHILAAALCVDSFGKRYIQSIDLVFKQPYYHADIQELCADELIDLVHQCNQNHFQTLGYLMSPTATEFDQEKALEIFERANSFEYTVTVETGEVA